MPLVTRRTLMEAGLAVAALGAMGMAKGTKGLSSSGLSKIKDAGRDVVASGDVPGVLTLVWRKGELVQLDTAGMHDIEQKLPIARDTIFAIASMSKPITVATALTLIDAGAMKLDDPITKWAPEFANMRVLKRADGPLDDTYPAPRAITIEDLMTHRAGFTYGFLAPGPIGAALLQKLGFGIESTLTPDEWLKTIASLPLVSAPGERFNYGHSIDVLGFVTARAAGKPLYDVMRTQLFDPLNMKDTSFWVPPEKRARRAATVTSPAPGKFQPATVESFVAATPPAYTSAGQGLLSTADDYLAFARMLLGGGKLKGARVLKEESVKRMTSDHITAAERAFPSMVTNWKSQGYGYGVMIIDDAKAYEAAGQGFGSAGTYGWGGAFGGWWQNDPREEMTLIWLQECLPPQPAPGTIPRIPGGAGLIAFEKAVYTALGA